MDCTGRCTGEVSSSTFKEFSIIDVAKLDFKETPRTIEKSLIKLVPVNYAGKMLTFQFVDPSESLRSPFGYDDGSKFNSKPSVTIELRPEQVAFVRQLEESVKDAAVKHKSYWFKGSNPSDEVVRANFSSRIKEDDEGKYPPALKVDAKNVKVNTTQRMDDGNLTPPKRGEPADVTRGCRFVPVVRTGGGVWIRKEGRGSFKYGLSLVATELLVVSGDEESGETSINFGGVEIVEAPVEADNYM